MWRDIKRDTRNTKIMWENCPSRDVIYSAIVNSERYNRLSLFFTRVHQLMPDAYIWDPWMSRDCAKLMHVNRIMQRLISDVFSHRALLARRLSSENDQVSHSQWSTSDKINGGRRTGGSVWRPIARQQFIKPFIYLLSNRVRHRSVGRSVGCIDWRW